MNCDFDVFIIGAGPAGAATAVSLGDVAPGLRVCLADAGRVDPLRIGESVPPPILPYLQHLGVAADFGQDGHCPSFRTMSAWGGPELLGNEFFLQVHNTGWRLDRPRFDGMLMKQAQRRGAQPLDAKVRSLAWADDHWRVDCGDGGLHTARCVVDASGRAALPSRLAGLRSVNLDRQVACVVFFEDSGNALPGADAALVESFRDGWWYTAAIPEGRRVAALMTDADIARRLRVSEPEAWMQCLNQSKHVRPLLAHARPLAAPRFWAAGTRYLQTTARPNFLAVGDAATSFDPLSSQGIIKALRSSIFASYAIADQLLRGDESGIARYAAIGKREFAAYRKTWLDYYRQEQRWPDAPFWQRRHRLD